MANVPPTFARMATLDHFIRDAVLDHLKRSGISGRRFGREVLRDPGFVASLKAGRRLSLKTADAVLAAMGEEPIGPAFAREVEAFLEADGIKPYVFGDRAAGDPSFIERLRRGVSFRLTTVEKVRDWMEDHADTACLAAMNRAVAGVPLLARGGGDDTEQGETDMDIDDGRCLSVSEASALLGISARTLYRLRAEGRGPDHYPFGHRILYRRPALERWAAEQLVPSPDGGGRRAP